MTTILDVKPSACVVWHGRRDVRALNRDSCADMIDALLASGRQEVPVIARPAPDGTP